MKTRTKRKRAKAKVYLYAKAKATTKDVVSLAKTKDVVSLCKLSARRKTNVVSLSSFPLLFLNQQITRMVIIK